MNNKKTKDQNKSTELYPRLNINFLKVIVIVLGLAIFVMISIIVFKILRGDLNKNNTEKINFSNLLIELTKRTLNENKFESNLFFL